jgi:gelsolin
MLNKQKHIAIADSNIALLGSDLEKKVRVAAAGHENAWTVVGKVEGIEIWRVEQFKIVPVPKNTYGSFYNGDSYILLKTYKVADQLAWNVHFWLGNTTSQDEAGTAAYKTVELDDYLGGKPVQYREISGHESSLFHSYFPKGTRVFDGGVASGFHNVKPEEYKPRLLQVKGKGKHVVVTQVPLTRDSLNSGDAFLLDLGLKVVQWMGSKVNVNERQKAAAFARALDDERGGKVTVEVHNEGDKDMAEFWKHLGGEGPIKSADAGGSDVVEAATKRLIKISDTTGTLQFTPVAEGKVTRSQLQSSDAFIFDIGSEIFAWIGSGASVKEKKSALQYALDYTKKYNRPSYLPIIRILEGGENEVFEHSFDK